MEYKKDEPKLKDETLSCSRRGDTFTILETILGMSRFRSIGRVNDTAIW